MESCFPGQMHMLSYRIHMEVIYEASHRTDAVLFWNGDDPASVYSGDIDNPDIYSGVPGAGISSVLLLTVRPEGKDKPGEKKKASVNFRKLKNRCLKFIVRTAVFQVFSFH